MILVYIKNSETAKILVESGSKLAIQLGKTFGVMCSSENKIEINLLLTGLEITADKNIINNESLSLLEICETEEVSFLFLQLTENNSKSIKYYLKECRELRIPYVLFKDSFSFLNLQKVILPIGFLDEEMEKAQFASAFGRFCNSEIQMILANDYGSKAALNAEKMKQIFDKFDFSYHLEKASKDSFKVELESIQTAEKSQAGLIIVSASREYGLDDIIFGPKEYHVVKKSSLPVLLVNPRADLYALCD